VAGVAVGTLRVEAAFELDWSYEYRGAGPTFGQFGLVSSVVFDSGGNVLVGGGFSEANRITGVLFKLNAAGEFQWAREVGSNAPGRIAFRADGMIEASMNVPGRGNFTHLFSPAGDPLGVIAYVNTNDVRYLLRGNVFGNPVRDPAGNYLNASVESSDLYIHKYSPGGNLLWSRTHPRWFGWEVTTLDIDAAGRLLVCGTGYGAYSVRLGVFDLEGEELWKSETISGSTPMAWWQEDGTVLGTGGGLTIDSTVGTTLVGYDAAGNMTETKWDGATYPRAHASDRKGRLVVAGMVVIGDTPGGIRVSEYHRVAVNGSPKITVLPPRSATVVDGQTLTLSVSADGAPPLRYQWRANGYPLADATNATLVWSNVTFHRDQSRLSVEVKNDLGSTVSSEQTLLTVLVPPRLLPPSVHILSTGDGLTMSADVWQATPPVTHRWFKDGVPILIQTNRLVLSDIQLSQAGIYRVDVSNIAGTATTQWHVMVCDRMTIEWAAVTTNTTVTPGINPNVSLDVDSDGNAYIAAGILTGSSSSSILAAKYSGAGVPLWTRSIPGLGTTAYADALKRDGVGGVYVVGRQAPGTVAVVKYREDGVPLWTNFPPKVAQSPVAFALAPDGGSYLAMSEQLDPGNVRAIGVTRLGPDGTLRWYTLLTNSGSIYLNNAAAGSTGMLIIGQVPILESPWLSSGFAALITDEGQVAWRDVLDGESWLTALAPAGDEFVLAGGVRNPLNSSIAGLVVARYGADGRTAYQKFADNYFGSFPSKTKLAVRSDRSLIVGVTAGLEQILSLRVDGTPIWTNQQAINVSAYKLDHADNLHLVGSRQNSQYYEYTAVKIDAAGRLLGLSRYALTPVSLESFVPAACHGHTDGTLYAAGIFGVRVALFKHGRPSVPTRLSLLSPDPGGRATLRLEAQAGSSYTVETATALGVWMPWTNAPNPSGTVEFESVETQSPQSFFRARRNP